MSDLVELIAAERRATADFLQELTDEQCATASLCDGWQVRHVAAHLTMQLVLGTPKLIFGVVKNLGNFNKFADTYAKSVREPIAVLAATMRAKADNRFSPPGVGAHAPLTDVVVHTLDMRVPLGIPGDGPAPVAMNEILDFLMTPKATRGFLPRGRVPGLSFESTDTGWKGGSGPVVRGTGAALALAITGRRAGLDSLDGDGVPEMRKRLG